MTELHFMTIAEAGKRLRQRELSPIDLARAYFARIKALDGQLNAYILPLEEQALADAARAGAEIAAGGWKGPLHGIPIGLKDIYNTAGITTTGHSALFQEHVPADLHPTATDLPKLQALVTDLDRAAALVHGPRPYAEEPPGAFRLPHP